MNDNTGEIRKGTLTELMKLFDGDTSWRPLNLTEGDVVEIQGFRFEILVVTIKPGKPGMMTLELKGLGKKE